MAVVSEQQFGEQMPMDWRVSQDEVAVRAVRYGAEHSPEIRHRLECAGIAPGDVQGVADLASVPVLAKDDLPALQAAEPPFGGMLAVPVGVLRRIYRSPGPINDPEGDSDDFWGMSIAVRAAGFRADDIVLNSLSYHLTPGGFMLDAGLREVGCTVIPGGAGNTAAQVETAHAAGATGYTGTPQFLLALLKRARDEGQRLSLERALVTGAPLPPSLRARLQEEFGVDVYQVYGTADAGMLGYECHLKGGWHVRACMVIEILAPGDDQPKADGEVGQVVVTSPNHVYPLVRFGTGDLSAWNHEPCPCRLPTPRLVGFLGRVGDGVKVRGMFVHPRELAEALTGHSVVARYQGVVTEDARGDDAFTVRIETQPGSAISRQAVTALEARIREAVKVRPVVRVVGPGEITEDARPLVDQRALEAGA